MSNKRFGTVETLQLAFQYPDTFFDLIRTMDDRGDISIPEHELIYSVERQSRRAPEKDRKRIILAFRTENLTGSGLVSVDKREGVPYLYFERALIDLLRICDRSLRQDLTNAKLKARLSSLRELRKQVIASSFNADSDEFKESSNEMSAEISSVIRLVHGNVRDLELDVAKRMEDISAEISVSENLTTARHYELLGEITSILKRHILPTLEFLNSETKLKDGMNLYETLESLGKSYRSHGFHELADQITRSLISLTQTYKPIQAIATQVQDFVAKNQRSLRQHNAMEQTFEKIRALMTETQTSNMKRTQMKGDGFVKEIGFLEGLTTKVVHNLTELHDDVSTLKLFQSDLQARTEDIHRSEDAPVLGSGEAARSRTGVDIDRTKKLYEWVRGMKIPETQDLVAHVHDRLQASVEGYDTLSDLMEAMGFITTNDKSPIRVMTTNRFRVLDSGDNQYVYRLKRVQKTSKETRNV